MAAWKDMTAGSRSMVVAIVVILFGTGAYEVFKPKAPVKDSMTTTDATTTATTAATPEATKGAPSVASADATTSAAPATAPVAAGEIGRAHV